MARRWHCPNPCPWWNGRSRMAGIPRPSGFHRLERSSHANGVCHSLALTTLAGPTGRYGNWRSADGLRPHRCATKPQAPVRRSHCPGLADQFVFCLGPCRGCKTKGCQERERAFHAPHQTKSICLLNGISRMRCPVAAKIALPSAGAEGGIGGSPKPRILGLFSSAAKVIGGHWKIRIASWA